MRCFLRLLALALVLVTVLWWSQAGARMGWWRDRTAVERTDEVTGLSVVEWREGFAPGLETPVLGLVAGGALFAATCLSRRSTTTNQKSQ